MSDVREEYTRENYPSFGKKYNGEKAIISLTSWRARINTCSKTIYSLIKQCPGFHIVLVLSEEEFPKMMDELPDNLKLFVDNELIEVLWVYKNYKSFKKVLFTMDKYRTVPVISADDDCIYTCNYAQELYNTWEKNKNKVINYRKSRIQYCTCGPACLFPPAFYSIFLENFRKHKIKSIQDDEFFRNILYKIKSYPFSLSSKFPCFFHDEIRPINGSYKSPEWINAQSF